MLLVMVLNLPNGFLAAFYALAIPRTDPPTMVRNGFLIVLANLAGLVLSVIGMILFIDYRLLHFLFVAGVCFLAFFLTRTLVSNSIAFGFGIVAVAAASVNIIWARPNPLRPDVETVVWTAFGMILGTLVTVAIEWLAAGSSPAPAHATHAPPLFVPDAFTNADYLKFALKGCLAATICYVTWWALGWPGLGVATVTCVIAAPVSTPGSSRRQLITRLAGWLTGGVVCGIGSQIFILPSVDTIVGFTLPFAAISGAAAWVVTSSPAFSYFGRQMALAYYLTMFQGFGINASLAASRDRLTGILLGLTAMWLVFDVLGNIGMDQNRALPHTP
jgi:Fusaric acid resistance protein family